MKYIFAGDRDISLKILEYLKNRNEFPEYLWLTAPEKATHDEELQKIVCLDKSRIISGLGFKNQEHIQTIADLKPDIIICIHFPYLIPDEILSIPRIGVINLHPAYLPFNRGWHTPSWAILDGTPFGATLHFMSKDLDMGPIIDRIELVIDPSDTANEIYAKVRLVELDLFKKSWPALVQGNYKTIEQDPGQGSSHRRKDLFSEGLQEINLKKTINAGKLIDRLRALTTSNLLEAAYFVKNNIKYRIQIKITKDEK